MGRADPQIVSFTSGELSPLLASRSDLAQYANGARISENFIPAVQGSASMRGGTHFAQELKDSQDRCWLAPFMFTAAQSYVLEFGPLYVRFYSQRGPVLDSGSPIEVATPWDVADLTNEDGCFALDIEQRGDVLYITSPDHWPRTLTRVSATSWVLALFDAKNGPFLDLNADKALRVYANARTGSVTVTASASFFTASHVGALIRIGLENIDIPPWEPGKAYPEDQLVRSDGKTYLALNADGARKSGTKTPIHEDGFALDGSGMSEDETPVAIGIQWQYQDPGYGLGVITAVASATSCTVAVDAASPFPANVVGSGNATNIWRIGAWGPHNEYPAKVAFWKGRLCFFGKRRFDMSVPRAYNDFSPDIVGEVRADAAISGEIETTQDINWAAPGDDYLVVGTESEEYLVQKATSSEPLGPGNIDARPRTSYGSRKLRPAIGAAGIYFAQKAGRRVREARINESTGDFEAPDLTILAEHVTVSGIVDWAWHSQPHRVLWAVRADGLLIGMTHEREQQVTGWHRHRTRGYVESVAVIPSPDGKREDLWLIVRRTIAGQSRRFVEWMDSGYEAGGVQSDAFYVDCGLSYSGPDAQTISGLDHYIGETVDVVVNGGAHPQRLVQPDGSIALEQPASKVHAGLFSPAIISPMSLEPGGARGTSQGKLKVIDSVAVSFLNTLGGKIGRDMSHLEAIQTRSSADPGGLPPALFSGTREMPFDGEHSTAANVVIVQDQPLPITITAILPRVTVEEAD